MSFNTLEKRPQDSSPISKKWINFSERGVITALFLSFFSIGLLALGDVALIRVVILFFQISICFFALPLIKNLSLAPRYSSFSIWLFFIWFVLSCCSVYLSEHFYPALIRQIEVVNTLLLGLIFSLLLLKKQFTVTKVTKTLLIAFSIIAVLELVRFKFKGDDIANWSSINSLKFYFSIRHFGHFSSVAVLLSLFFVASRNRTTHWLGCCSLFIATLALFFCAGRAAVLFTLCLVVLILILSIKNRGGGVRATSVMALGFLASFYFVSDSGSHFGVMRIVSETSAISNVKLSDLSEIGQLSTGRDVIWQAVFRETLESPWLGKGPDHYIFIQPHLYGQTPHNFVLQFALAWGWPAAILATLMLTMMSWAAFKTIFKTAGRFDIKAYWSAAFLVFIANGLVSSTLYQPVNMLIFSIMLGVCFQPYALLNKSQEEKDQEEHQEKQEKIQINNVKMSMLAGLLACFTITNILAFRSMYYQSGPGSTPSPYSQKVDFVESYPFTLIGYHKWILEWQKTHPEFVAEKAQWAAENAEYIAWEYYAIASKSYKDQGQLVKANKMLSLARKYAGESKPNQERIDFLVKEAS